MRQVVTGFIVVVLLGGSSACGSADLDDGGLAEGSNSAETSDTAATSTDTTLERPTIDVDDTTASVSEASTALTTSTVELPTGREYDGSYYAWFNEMPGAVGESGPSGYVKLDDGTEVMSAFFNIGDDTFPAEIRDDGVVIVPFSQTLLIKTAHNRYEGADLHLVLQRGEDSTEEVVISNIVFDVAV